MHPYHLLTGEWQALAINNGKEAVVSVQGGTTVTAIFGADGKLSGNAGCNTYNGTYTTDGDKITIDLSPPPAWPANRRSWIKRPPT